MFSGLPILILIYAAFNYFEQRLNPDDSQYRQQPKIGDIVFLNYYQLSGEANQILRPYRMAKISAISPEENTVKLNLGIWSYGDQHTVTKEFFTRRDSHLSYYGGKKLSLSFSVLMDEKLVWKMRRREFFVDIEQHQNSTRFEKNFLIYPTN